MIHSLAAAVERHLAGVDPTRVGLDVDLAPFCTYRVGGLAAVVVEAESEADLEAVSDLAVEENCPILVVGKGSNLLVSDAGFDGVVVRLGESYEFIDFDLGSGSSQLVVCGAAALLPVAARRTAAAGLSGFEWAVGVPGSIGGAVRMNAGGHGSDMAASVVSASIFDIAQGRSQEWAADELGFGYRTSLVGPGHVVLSCRLELHTGDAERSAAEISEIVRWRRANQPGGQNAGSVFANPEGDSAGRLIDSLGLKGFSIGTASVSEKHANFIQAEPNGSADDVFQLIVELRRRVHEAYEIQLKPENVLVGFDDAAGRVVDSVPLSGPVRECGP